MKRSIKWIIVAVLVALLAGVIAGIIILVIRSKDSAKVYSFPSDFKIGAASSAYQIEGGWDEDGKSPSIWDTLTQNHPDSIADKSNGNVAVDSYHMMDKDIAALKNANVSGRVIEGWDLNRFVNEMKQSESLSTFIKK